MLRALRRDDADLGQMAAQSVERRRALAGEQLARPMAHQRGLVLDRTHRHEAAGQDALLASQIAAASTCVVLVAPDVGLHVRGRDQPHFKPSSSRLPPPMMRRGARFHRHHAWRQRGEKRDELGAPELAGNDDLAIGVDRVNLKDPLRQIQTDPRDASKIPDRLAHGRLPFRWGFDNDHLGTLMPFGAVAVDTVFEGKRKISPTTRTRTVLIADIMMLEREAALKPAR